MQCKLILFLPLIPGSLPLLFARACHFFFKHWSVTIRLSLLPNTYMYIVYYSFIQWTALPRTNGSVAETGRPSTVKDSSMFPLTAPTCAANVPPEPEEDGSVEETGRPSTVKDSSMFHLTAPTCAANVLLEEEVHVSCITYHYILPHIVHVRMDSRVKFYTFVSQYNVTKIFFLFLSCKQWRWNSHTTQLHIQGRMRVQRKEIYPW